MIEKMKIAMRIIAVIAAVSYALLGARIVYVAFFADKSTTVIIPDNIIGGVGTDSEEEKTEVLYFDLTERDAEDEARFAYGNVMPGDTYTKYYCLKVEYPKEADIEFFVDDIRFTKSLEKILNLKVSTINGDGTENVLYDGVFIDAYKKPLVAVAAPSSDGAAYVYYKVDVTLPTYADNSYSGARLTANFNFKATAEKIIIDDADPLPPEAPVIVESPEHPIWPWVILPTVSIVSLIALTLVYRYVLLPKSPKNTEDDG